MAESAYCGWLFNILTATELTRCAVPRRPPLTGRRSVQSIGHGYAEHWALPETAQARLMQLIPADCRCVLAGIKLRPLNPRAY